MNKPLVWSPLALESYQEMARSLKQEWGEKVKNKFRKEVLQTINRLAQNPSTFPLVYDFINLRKAVIHKNSVLYYRETEKQIIIVALFDPRKDPEKLAFLLLN